jgi:hypothetical protein
MIAEYKTMLPDKNDAPDKAAQMFALSENRAVKEKSE